MMPDTFTDVDLKRNELHVHLMKPTANDLWQRVGWLVAGFASNLDKTTVLFTGQATDASGEEVTYDFEDEARVVQHVRGTLHVRTIWDEAGDSPAVIHVDDTHEFQAHLIIPLTPRTEEDTTW